MLLLFVVAAVVLVALFGRPVDRPKPGTNPGPWMGVHADEADRCQAGRSLTTEYR